MTHICVVNLAIIGSDNGLSPGRRQAITWSNVGILLIGPLGTNFCEMLIEIHTFSFQKIHSKMSAKWRPHWGRDKNGRHIPDDIFKRICLNENVSISLKISLKFVPKVQFNNIQALLQIMAWRRPGHKPLSEPMVVSLLTHLYASLGLNDLMLVHESCFFYCSWYIKQCLFAFYLERPQTGFLIW